MKFRALFAATSLAAVLGSVAVAASDEVLNQIVKDLAAQGFSHIEIKNAPDWVKVEAYGANGALEQVYDGQGNLIREQVREQTQTQAGMTDDDSPDMEDGEDDDSPDREQARDQDRDQDHDQNRDQTGDHEESHDRDQAGKPDHDKGERGGDDD